MTSKAELIKDIEAGCIFDHVEQSIYIIACEMANEADGPNSLDYDHLCEYFEEELGDELYPMFHANPFCYGAI